MPMVTTRMSDAVPITMPSAVRANRTLLLQKVSKAKLTISLRTNLGGLLVAALVVVGILIRCYAAELGGAIDTPTALALAGPA